MIQQQIVAFATAFAGSAVESVEALTIVLAVGLTQGWRYPLYATAAAVATLAAMVLLLGGVILALPDATLKIAVGSLIILFGMRWLHKAVLRSAGVIKMHDEEAAFEETVHEVQARKDRWVGFTTCYNGVLLEGLEVVFIVIAVAGATKSLLVPATAGGLAASVVVAAAGVVVRHPLAKVPENALKYSVGIALTSLGSFWAAEGMGVRWPGDFIWIVVIAVILLVASRLAVALIKGGAPEPVLESAA